MEAESMAKSHYKLIYEYEEKKKIPLEERSVEYIEKYDNYLPVMGIDIEKIKARYALAVKELSEDKKRIKGIYKVTLSNNIKDSATFAPDNFQKMLDSFYGDKYKKKELYLKIETEEYLLLAIREGMEYPECVDNDEVLSNSILAKYQRDWFLEYIKRDKEKIALEAKNIAMKAESSLSPKQPGVNYTREIKKALENRNVITDKRMERYDFREVSLNGVVFINCYLKGANFAHVNLTGTVFINCNLDEAVFYGVEMNGAIVIEGESFELKEKLSKEVFI